MSKNGASFTGSGFSKPTWIETVSASLDITSGKQSAKVATWPLSQVEFFENALRIRILSFSRTVPYEEITYIRLNATGTFSIYASNKEDSFSFATLRFQRFAEQFASRDIKVIVSPLRLFAVRTLATILILGIGTLLILIILSIIRII